MRARWIIAAVGLAIALTSSIASASAASASSSSATYSNGNTVDGYDPSYDLIADDRAHDTSPQEDTDDGPHAVITDLPQTNPSATTDDGGCQMTPTSDRSQTWTIGAAGLLLTIATLILRRRHRQEHPEDPLSHV